MDTLKFNIDIEPIFHKNPPKVKIHINDHEIFNGVIDKELKIEEKVELADDESHKLKITLYGKSAEDTIINEDGTISEDQLIRIKEIMIDDIDLSGTLTLDQEKFYYEHDGNGSHELKRHPLFDTMGCNGDAVISFTTPFYVWLLETL